MFVYWYCKYTDLQGFRGAQGIIVVLYMQQVVFLLIYIQRRY